MKPQTTLFLAVIALALALYFWMTGMDSPGTNEMKRRSEKVLVLEPSSVDRLELINVEGSYIFTKNSLGKWMIEAPVAYAAENTAVSSLLSELEFARRKATLEEKELRDHKKALSDFGLEPARIQLKIRQKDKTYQLTLGNETARSGLIYALISDGKKEEMTVIEKTLETLLSKGLNEWRSRKIMEFLTADVTALNLRKAEAETEVVKEGGLWKINKPLMTAADENEVASFLANLSAAQASGFVSDNAADIGVYGLTSPTLTLEVSQGDKKETIRVGSELVEEKGFYYAQMAGRPTVLKINQNLFQSLAGMMDQLRDKRILVLPPTDTIQKMKIEKGGLILDFQAASTVGSEWEFIQPENHPLDGEKVKTFLESLKSARASAFQPVSEDLKKKLGLTKPVLTVSLTIRDDKGQSQERILQFSAPKKGEFFVETSFRTTILTLPESAFPILPALISDWYGKILKPPFIGEPDYLKWDFGGRLVELRKDAQGNWPSELEGKPLERGILDKQLEVLSGIPLGEWTPVTDKSFGLPYLRLTYGQGKNLRTLEFGKELEKNARQARILTEDIAFSMNNQGYLLFQVLPVKTDVKPAQ
jgi:hypothetical protein